MHLKLPHSPTTAIILSVVILHLFCISSTDGLPSLRDTIEFVGITEKQFLNTIQPISGLKPLLSAITNGTLTAEQMFSLITSVYLGELIVVIVGVTFFLVNLVGIICLCVCRLCLHRCGAKISHTDAKDSARKRIIYAVFLVIFAIAMTFFLFLTIFANVNAHEVVQYNNSSNASIPNIVLHTVKDLRDLFDNFKGTYKTQLATNFANSQKALNDVFDQGLKSFGTDLKALSKLDVAVANDVIFMLKINQFRGEMNSTAVTGPTVYVPRAVNFTAQLSSVASALSDALSSSCYNVTTNLCDSLITSLSNLSVGFDYTKVNFSGPAQCLANLDSIYNWSAHNSYVDRSSTFINSIINQTRVITQIAHSIVVKDLNQQDVIMLYFVNLDPLLNDIVGELQTAYNNLSTGIVPGTAGLTLADNGLQYLDSYRFYPCLAMSVLGGVLVAMFFTAVGFGCCGEPPIEDASYCNKSRGASILTGALFLALIGFGTILVIETVLFLPGGVAYTEVCRYVNDTNGTAILKESVNVILRANAKLTVFDNLTDDLVRVFVVSCAESKSLIETLGLNKFVNFENVFNTYITGIFTAMGNDMAKLNYTTGITAILDTLKPLQSDLSCNFSDSLRALANPITLNSQHVGILSNLTLLLNIINITESANSTNGTSQQNLNYSAVVRPAASAFTTLVNTMDTTRGDYRQSFRNMRTIQNDLKQVLVPLTIQSWTDTVTLMHGSARETATTNLKTYLTTTCKKMLTDIVNKLLSSLTTCVKFASILRISIHLGCEQYVTSVNSYWAAMGMVLMCMVPCILFAGGLSSLYRKSMPFIPDGAEEVTFMSSQMFYPLGDDGKPIGKQFFLARLEDKNTVSEV